MNKRSSLTAAAALAVASLSLSAAASAAGSGLAPCDALRTPGNLPNTTYCSIPVPNGDFAGVPPPVGDEGSRHKHPWEPSFSWIPVAPNRKEHPILDHLAPWEFHGDTAPDYPRTVNAQPGVVLAQPGDAVFQWIPVPRWDGTQATATSYIVRVTYARHGAAGSAGLNMRLIAADENEEHASIDVEDRQATTPGRPATFNARIEVPGGTSISQLGLAVGKGGDTSPVVILDVALTELTHPDIEIDF